ncbi:MAG: hypothetical protein IH571_00295 [Acholeplasmataceae bacterium]|nr:hypothetical protein [Acholeplasmataceae bacterium]
MKAIIFMLISIFSMVAFMAEAITVSHKTIEIHQVIYADHQGNVIHISKVQNGVSLVAFEQPTEPFREGYVFIGWNHALPILMPNENVVLVATYIKSETLVTIEIPGA